MKRLLLIAAIAVAGCSSFGPVEMAAMNSAIQQGRCSDAAAIANQTTSIVKYNNLAVVAENCERNSVKARSYLEYGARLGEQNAIGNLLRIGVPVPNADLKARNDAANAANDRAVSDALLLLQASRPQHSSSPSVNCTSRAVGNTVQTNCF